MKTITALVLALAAGGPAWADDEPAASRFDAGAVTILFGDVHEFTDFRYSGWTEEKTLSLYGRNLSKSLTKRSIQEALDGNQVVLTVQDVDLAGDVQPWRNRTNSDIRYLQDIYPPRVKLTYEVRSAAGEVLLAGEERLIDLNYLSDIGAVTQQGDPFYYDVELVENWIRRDLLPKVRQPAS